MCTIVLVSLSPSPVTSVLINGLIWTGTGMGLEFSSRSLSSHQLSPSHVSGFPQCPHLRMCWTELEDGLAPVQTRDLDTLSCSCSSRFSGAASGFLVAHFYLKDTYTSFHVAPSLLSESSDDSSSSFPGFGAAYRTSAMFPGGGIFRFLSVHTVKQPLRLHKLLLHLLLFLPFVDSYLCSPTLSSSFRNFWAMLSLPGIVHDHVPTGIYPPHPVPDTNLMLQLVDGSETTGPTSGARTACWL